MKKIFRKIVLLVIYRNAKQYLKKYKPNLIVVCGQKYRSNIKEDIVEAYKNAGIYARGSFKGYNSEIGIPLSILNLKAGFTSVIKWFKLILSSFKALNDINSPKILVLEIVAENRREMNNLLKIIKPNLLIFTDFDKSFDNELKEVYEKMVFNITGEGTLLVNNDYQVFGDLGQGRGDRTLTFGKSSDADIKASEIKDFDNGQEFTYSFNNISDKISLQRFGEQIIYSAIISKFLLSQL